MPLYDQFCFVFMGVSVDPQTHAQIPPSHQSREPAVFFFISTGRKDMTLRDL